MTGKIFIPTYQVSRSRILKRVQIKFTCTRCSEPLTAREDEVGQPDHCPTCGQSFTLSRRRLTEFLSREGARRERVVVVDASKVRTSVGTIAGGVFLGLGAFLFFLPQLLGVLVLAILSSRKK